MLILIDAQHHFNLQNLISILSYFDTEIVPPGPGHDSDMTRHGNGNTRSPKLISYLKRLFFLPCFSLEDLMRNFLPQPRSERSQLENILLSNPAVSLVLIDSIDAFVYISENQTTIQQNRNILQLVRHAVNPTSTPVISTRLGEQYGESRLQREHRLASTSSPYAQILLDEALFTLTLSLVPLSPQPLTLAQLNYKPFAEQSRKEEEEDVWNKNVRIDCVAHLRSRSKSRHGNPNPGSGIAGSRNHRVKFSIFSGMLWVFEEGKDKE